jgi:hypothetical protein
MLAGNTAPERQEMLTLVGDDLRSLGVYGVGEKQKRRRQDSRHDAKEPSSDPQPYFQFARAFCAYANWASPVVYILVATTLAGKVEK